MDSKDIKKKLVKAYNNWDFLNGPDARIVRVLAEMVEPATRFRKLGIRNTVVFFGSARTLPADTAMSNLRAVEAKMRQVKKVSPKLKENYHTAMRNLKTSRYFEDASDLSEKLALWFKQLRKKNIHFSICSGGGPGIMAAANKGAWKAKEKSIGLNISLPMEQYPNPYQDKELSFEFHYFFIRKFWFTYPAKALVVFPGGFGTMDELFELLTLIQTQKTKKYMPIVLYGKEYWEEVINLKKMLDSGYIDASDLKLFKIFDDVNEAFDFLKGELKRHYVD
ncbi:MAG: LOG family protein [Candidatus Omnitrophica bacterium]|nr:LOG family protein [Candidatus Omnitrophota bacterium]